MYVTHIKSMATDMFLSLSDETKIKMIRNQLFFMIHDDDDHNYQDVFTWLCDNSVNPFYIVKEKDKDSIKAWVYFYDEVDVVSFKIRWI